MISNEYENLIDRLKDRTVNGEVNWHQTVNDNEYMVYFKNFSLSVSSSFDQDEDMEYILISLRNDSGEEIDRFWISARDPHWSLANQLYSGARRKALQIDEALHTIMGELDTARAVGLEKKPTKTESDIDDDIPF